MNNIITPIEITKAVWAEKIWYFECPNCHKSMNISGLHSLCGSDPEVGDKFTCDYCNNTFELVAL